MKMSKITGFLEIEREDRDYAPVSERTRHFREFVLPMYDQDGDACIIVLKRGRTTGLTVGRATTFVSYTRKYFSDNNTAISKELTIPSRARNWRGLKNINSSSAARLCLETLEEKIKFTIHRRRLG